jgi:hypothetical protein
MGARPLAGGLLRRGGEEIGGRAAGVPARRASPGETESQDRPDPPRRKPGILGAGKARAACTPWLFPASFLLLRETALSLEERRRGTSGETEGTGRFLGLRPCRRLRRIGGVAGVSPAGKGVEETACGFRPGETLVSPPRNPHGKPRKKPAVLTLGGSEKLASGHFRASFFGKIPENPEKRFTCKVF